MKKNLEEEKWDHQIHVSSTNVERDDRLVEEEQYDILISKKESYCPKIMHGSKGYIIFSSSFEHFSCITHFIFTRKIYFLKNITYKVGWFEFKKELKAWWRMGCL